MDIRLKFFLPLLAVFSMTITYGQDIQESISWSKDFRLSWEYFKGPVPPDAVAAATTASGISYEYSANLMFNEVSLDFKVDAFFYPQESWYKPAVCDSVTLNHEQLHFDIAELYARKMRKQLQETSFSDNVKAEVREIYQNVLHELASYQERYDWETDFSRNLKAQLRWQKKIEKALLESSEFSN